MGKTVMNPVGDRAIVEQRGKYLADRMQHVVDAGDIEEGFLLTGKGGVGQILRGGRRAHCNGDFGAGFLDQRGIRFADFLFEPFRKRRLDHRCADGFAGNGERLNVFDIERFQLIADFLVQSLVLEKLAVSLCCCCKTIRHLHAGSSQIGDHFAERGVLAANNLDITHTQIGVPENLRAHA